MNEKRKEVRELMEKSNYWSYLPKVQDDDDVLKVPWIPARKFPLTVQIEEALEECDMAREAPKSRISEYGEQQPMKSMKHKVRTPNEAYRTRSK